jgi:hypothetical protein
MGLYRIPITRDNTISTVNMYGNAGASQIVDVWGHYDDVKGVKYLARFLALANLTGLQAAIAAGDVPNVQTDATVTCLLNFFNITTAEPQAYDFTLEVYPLTASWTEGQGTRIDSFQTTGYSNWVQASPTGNWVSSGGDYDPISPGTATQYFETGAENLSVNFRTMLNNWLSGASANYGFIVKMNSTAEDLTASNTAINTQYWRKAFHGRTTNYPNYAPRIELQWNDKIADQRQMVNYGTAATLYLYNIVNGTYSDIDGITTYFPGTVTVSGLTADGSSAVTSNLTAARVKKGVYSVSVNLPVSAASYTAFQDVWSITSSASAVTPTVTQGFTPKSPVQNQQSVDWYKVSTKIIDWKGRGDDDAIFTKGMVKTFRVFNYQKTGKIEPVLVQSEKNSISSIASSAVSSLLVTDGYWRIVTTAFDTPDIDWQPLSYDSFSNYFTLDTNQLARQVSYRIQFKLNVEGETIIKSEYGNQFEIE